MLLVLIVLWMSKAPVYGRWCQRANLAIVTNLIVSMSDKHIYTGNMQSNEQAQ